MSHLYAFRNQHYHERMLLVICSVYGECDNGLCETSKFGKINDIVQGYSEK